MKYILYMAFAQGVEIEHVHVFPPFITHFDMARKLKVKPISAGFVRLGKHGIECYGASDSLKLSSRVEDAYFFNL